MNSIIEAVVQIVAVALGIWLFKSGYEANKTAKKYNLRTYFQRYRNPVTTENIRNNLNEGMDAYFAAGWLFVGAAIVVIVVLKILSCGVICPAWY